MTRSRLVASGELDWRVWGIQSSERHCCSPSWFGSLMPRRIFAQDFLSIVLLV
jgi:hypothetical protein